MAPPRFATELDGGWICEITGTTMARRSPFFTGCYCHCEIIRHEVIVAAENLDPEWMMRKQSIC
jgi:hypothetical protein